MSPSWQVKHPVTVEIGGAVLHGTIAGFPSKRVEYATRPVIVKIGPAEYVTVDLSKLSYGSTEVRTP